MSNETLGAAPATMYYSYGATLPSWETPCSCCGATWSPKAVQRPSTGRGINIYAGEMGSNARRKKSELSHIKTRNGTLTIVIKTVE
jgi:hypothetical protein